MGVEQSQRFCDHCEEYVLAVRKRPNHILHLLLSIITGGIWIIIWILVSVKMGGWRCSKCGSPVYKLFTTKDIDNKPEQNTKLSHASGGSYSRALPISFMFIGAFALLMAVVRKEIAPFLLAGVCLGVGYLLYVGRQK